MLKCWIIPCAMCGRPSGAVTRQNSTYSPDVRSASKYASVSAASDESPPTEVAGGGPSKLFSQASKSFYVFPGASFKPTSCGCAPLFSTRIMFRPAVSGVLIPYA